jgi:hypothetical protein
MEDDRLETLQWAANECRIQRDNCLTWARDASRRLRRIEDMIAAKLAARPPSKTTGVE